MVTHNEVAEKIPENRDVSGAPSDLFQERIFVIISLAVNSGTLIQLPIL
jgi:hypothetical protein